MSTNKKSIFKAPAHPEAEMQLSNPVSDQHAAFLFGNVAQYQEAYGGIPTMVQPDSAKGKSVVICGAGPSLAEHAADYCNAADQVWGCNSAATWLYEKGYKVTHGFTCDQTAYMVSEWITAPPIEYILATTVHVHLSEYLIKQKRKLLWYHNYVGIKLPDVEYDGRKMSWEDWAYTLLWPPCMRAGSGLNAVTRAIDVATFMGFDRITVLGADCSLRTKTGKGPNKKWPYGSAKYLKWLRENTVFHVDGGHALASEATAMVLGATIDGRYWLTKPDIAITAHWLVRMTKASGGKIRLIGDTLPNALMDKDDAFWLRMPGLGNSAGERMVIPF